MNNHLEAQRQHTKCGCRGLFQCDCHWLCCDLPFLLLVLLILKWFVRKYFLWGNKRRDGKHYLKRKEYDREWHRPRVNHTLCTQTHDAHPLLLPFLFSITKVINCMLPRNWWTILNVIQNVILECLRVEFQLLWEKFSSSLVVTSFFGPATVTKGLGFWGYKISCQVHVPPHCGWRLLQLPRGGSL